MDRPTSTNGQPDPQRGQSRDSGAWARPVDRLHVTDVPEGAVNINVDGRGVVGPLQGFGPLWQKTYRVRLKGASVTPAQVIAVWKERFAELQPRQNRIYPSLAGVRPGEVLLLNATLRGIPVNAGLMVLYADDESFTLMTPEGLPESGWITCSAFEDKGGCTVAQIRTQGRANDPIYEIGLRMVGARAQEKIWRHVLFALAKRFGVNGRVVQERECLDPGIRWSGVGNIALNAGVRSMAYTALAPVRWLRPRPRRRARAGRKARG